MAVSAPLGEPPRRRHGFAIGLLTGLVVAGGLGAGAYLATRPKANDATTLSPAPSTIPSSTPSPSPTPSPTTQSPPAIVRSVFQSRQPVMGERLTLRVSIVTRDFGCRLHSYEFHGEVLGAFLDDCPFLANQGYSVVMFDVALKNGTASPLSFNLRNFVLKEKDGSTFGPVNILSVNGVAAANYIHETGKLLPHSRIDGWLTFDARTAGPPPIASSLSYIDRGQTLMVVFQGKHIAG
jgi:hypothetical protein